MYGTIYRVVNRINGKIYIGQTVNGVNKRKTDHYSNARTNKFDTPFHRAIRKYGENNFKWDEIDIANSKDELNEKEKYWISFYDSMNKEKGYNATVGGDAFGGKGEDNFWHGKKMNQIHKAKISESLKKTRKERGHPSNKAIIQLTYNGEFIKEYKSSVDAEIEITGKKGKSINGCCNGRSVSCYGFLWINKDNYNDENVKILVEKFHNSDKTPKAVIQLSLNGEFIKEFATISDAILEVGGSDSNLTACCKGRQKTHKGFKWLYKKDYFGE